MFDRKYLQSYRIIFLAFEYLLQELTPFICPFTIQFVTTPILLRKAVKMILYQLAHGISLERMNALYNVGAFIIKKYTYIVCDVLSNGDKLFSIYVHTPIRDRLLNIIEQFHDIIGMQQICGVIDGTHIPLNVKPNKRITSFTTYFYNRKCFHSIMFQVVCDCDMFFWNACIRQLGGMANGGQFKMSSLYCSFQLRQILQEPVVTIEGVHIQPYLLGNATYLIWPYLLKGYKPRNSDMVDQIGFDQSMNKGHILIENAFGILKN
jgi:hypothetical protein